MIGNIIAGIFVPAVNFNLDFLVLAGGGGGSTAFGGGGGAGGLRSSTTATGGGAAYRGLGAGDGIWPRTRPKADVLRVGRIVPRNP